MASASVQAAFAGLKDQLSLFYDSCDGDCDDIAALFSAMSGQRLPAQALYGIMGISPDFVSASIASGKPIIATREQLERGLLAALDEGDTADMYINVLQSQINSVKARREGTKARESLVLDSETALLLEETLLKKMQESSSLREHLSSVRSLHEAWREKADIRDPSKFPVVVAGPQVVAMDRMHYVAHSELLTSEQRAKFFLHPSEDAAPFLISKLASHRATGPVAALQVKRICWLAQELTGVTVSSDELEKNSLVESVDEVLAKRAGDSSFLAEVDEILQDVRLGHSQARIKLVEGKIAAEQVAACQASGLEGLGYDAIVWLSSAAALNIERFPPGSGKPSPTEASDKAIKVIRRKIGERFFRKKWLPLESNPDIFNQLGRQLGLPSTVQFYEVFGMDEELLAMVPTPVTAVLVCFPLTPEYRKSFYTEESAQPDVSASSGPYFLQQTVSNACGTVALIHAYAAHAATAGVASDGWLGSFVGRTAGKTSVERAACLEDDEALAVSHNDMARQGDTRVEDFGNQGSTFVAVLHFITYICHEGTLYELDGLKKAPVAKGPTSPQTLLGDTAKAVAALLPADELRVNLMALAVAS